MTVRGRLRGWSVESFDAWDDCAPVPAPQPTSVWSSDVYNHGGSGRVVWLRSDPSARERPESAPRRVTDGIPTPRRNGGGRHAETRRSRRRGAGIGRIEVSSAPSASPREVFPIAYLFKTSRIAQSRFTNQSTWRFRGRARRRIRGRHCGGRRSAFSPGGNATPQGLNVVRDVGFLPCPEGMDHPLAPRANPPPVLDRAEPVPPLPDPPPRPSLSDPP